MTRSLKKVLSLSAAKVSILVFFALTVLPFTNATAGWRSMTMSGQTGLINLPSARVSWEKRFFGLDLGYHYASEGSHHLPKVTATMFNRWELGGVFDSYDPDNSDVMMHTKFRFYPWTGAIRSALALGGKYQTFNDGNNNGGQLYLAMTYPGRFLGMPAETSMLFGYSFGDLNPDSNVDFGMGFDLFLLPSVFKGYIHWIADFTNHPNLPIGPMRTDRGIFNTGLRITPINSSRGMTLAIDVLLLDGLDTNRSFGIGLDFGIAL